MTNRSAYGRVAFIVLCVGTITIGTSERAAAQSRCQALKYKAAGAVAKAKATCRARAAKAGVPVDQACIDAADQALARKWGKAERQDDCVTTDDVTEGVTATDQCLARIDDIVDPPPPPSSLCCNLGASCLHGPDAAACTGYFLGGTVGPEGSVCDGATGSCSMPPVGTGRCCEHADGFCEAGPTLDLSGCAFDFPFNSTCAPSGSCTFTFP